MAAKSFHLASDKLTADDHAKCIHKCGRKEGDMLRCQHLNSVGQLPCNAVVHVSCILDFDKMLIPYLSKFYCANCCRSSVSLQEEMIKVMKAARQALALPQKTYDNNVDEDMKRLREKIRILEGHLGKTTTQLQAQLTLNDQMERRLDQAESERDNLRNEMDKLCASSSKTLKRSASEAEKVYEEHNEEDDTEFDANETIFNASQVLRMAENQRIKMQNKLISTSSSRQDNKHHPDSYSSDLNEWPDYEKQEAKANEMPEISLSLLRSSIAKPKPFQGDITTWAIFLSEFKRTSARGHYRSLEDIDRLRELITGDAFEMFGTELADPFAEPIQILKRLDDFYGVKGSAVRVSLDKLISLSKIDKPTDKGQIKAIYISAKSFAHQCRFSKKESELTSQAVIYILESKMHIDHSKAWRMWARENHKEESVDGIVSFLEERIRELNMMPQKSKAVASVHVTEVTGGLAPTTSQSVITSTKKDDEKSNEREKRRKKREKRLEKIECFKCKEHHPFWKCPILIKASDATRLQIVNHLQVCHRCLSSTRHDASNCPNKLMQCRVPDCTAVNKHPLLHGHPSDKIKRFTEINIHRLMNVSAKRLTSHYGMIPGHVVARNGELISVLVMIDSGSGISLSTKSLFVRSGLKQTEQYELSMKWTNDSVHVEANAISYDIPFIPYFKKEPIILRNITAIEDSSLDLPEQQQNAECIKKVYKYLKDIPFPSYALQKPQILLGLPHFGLVAHTSCVSGPEVNDPVAVLSKLGWVIYGTQTEGPKFQKLNQVMAVGFSCVECTSNDMSNEALFEHFKYYNSIENMGIAHKEATLLSENDQIAQELIKQTMKYDPALKRYEIGLLWRPDAHSMPDNYSQALSRLEATEKRLKKLKMEKFVNEQFRDQIKAGWLVETTKEEASMYPRRNYVYGFIVFNKNKTPPKPRWVNDTAAKFKGVSLNSMLLKGPDNLVPLQQAICVGRECRIAFQADIKAMFNQINLRYEDQFSQLCLWRDCDASHPPRIYRQTRIIFGPTSSPAEANAVRIEHANQCKEKYPQAAEVALNQMYVDDVTDSRDTEEEAANVANQLIEMFDLIGWPLVEFYSNSQSFLSMIPEHRIGKKLVEIGEEDENFITKILGLFWKPQKDVFRLNNNDIITRCKNENYNFTKREILGIIMRIFDPLGLIIPFRICGLIIMQHIWRTGADWRSKLDTEIADEFRKWINEFEAVTRLEIPRCYVDVPLKECELSLHVFVDAGTEAYAACIYLRAVHYKSIYVRLIAAKGRVAPIKYVSIPKLELMSALLGARLLKSVKVWHRRLNITDYYCWTDSLTSYKWIKSPHLPRTQFTAPRISEIQELTSADKWRYVPSKQNVADFGTKQREMDYSNPDHEWFCGPSFLYASESSWPKQPADKSSRTESSHVFHVGVLNGNDVQHAGIIEGISPKVRSDWSIYRRVVATALRFVDRIHCMRPRNFQSGPITIDEVARAENFIIRSIQMAVYPQEYMRLKKSQPIHKDSRLKSLSVLLCPLTALIRVITRLPASFPLDQRQPPLLPNFHETSDTIARYFHKQQLHVNDGSIVGAIRARVWIVSTKRIVRRIRARCPLCIMKRAKAMHPTGSSLPEFRLDITKKPFYYTGCDLFGPYETYIKRSKCKETIYVVIFTCLVTRAVYFETLNDMSTKCFLVALDKLWARRGPIVHIHSDNGRNFCGASKVIEERTLPKLIKSTVETTDVQNALMEKKIFWHFTPPYTPQFGGSWERLIKDTKRALDASIGKFTVPRTSFEAALAKIEANLNNRPLTDLPVSPEDQNPITPYLLMQGFPNYPILHEGCCQNGNSIPQLKDAEQINALVQTFRSRFVREYAPIITRTMPNGNRKTRKCNELKLGDIVIYLDPTLNPCYWPKGVISRTYPGKDRKVRVVDVKLAGGKVLERRSAHRVAKLDLKYENPEAEQNRYNATVKKNSNNLTTNSSNNLTKHSSNKPIRSARVFINKKTSSLKMVNSLVFDDDLSLADGINKIMNPSFNQEDKEKYLDLNGSRTVRVENLPPNLGATEIFQIFERFGNLVTIKATSYDGVRPTACMLVFETEFAAVSSTNFNGSQAVVTNGKAFTTKIVFPTRHTKIIGRGQERMLISLESKIYQMKHTVLFITNKRPNKLCLNAPMEITSNAYGHVWSLAPEMKFDHLQMSVNMGDLDNELNNAAKSSKMLITVPIETSSRGISSTNDSSETSSQLLIVAPVSGSNNNSDPSIDIELNWNGDPFSDEEVNNIGDLRELLKARRNRKGQAGKYCRHDN